MVIIYNHMIIIMIYYDIFNTRIITILYTHDDNYDII